MGDQSLDATSCWHCQLTASQSAAARPMRVQAKSVSPQDSQLGPQSSFASVALTAKILNFCRSLDSNRCQHLQYLAKGRNRRPATRVTGGALPLPTIQYLFTISLAKTQTDSDGVVRMCSFSSPPFRGTQGRRIPFPVCSLRALE